MVISENGKEVRLLLHRFALVGPSDKILLDSAQASRIFVESADPSRKAIPVSPHFEKRSTLRLGARDYSILVKEITTPSDLKEYEYLEGFHYKTSSAIVTDEDEPSKSGLNVGGRKAILIAYIQVGKRMIPAGYIDLQMPLLMVKPRHELFNNGFFHPDRDISWDTWDIKSMRKYVNLIVRIARIVTSPDLRGLGLARIIIDAAKDYARERWHVYGKSPLFMEISAEMLKYMDFVTSAGMHFVGNTEGNLSRVHKDLLQMQRGQKLTFGIMTLQKKYLTNLRHLSESLHISFPEVLDRLKALTKNSSEKELRSKLNKLSGQEWFLFKRVLRFPIPYFICGLDDASESFVQKHSLTPPSKTTQNKTFQSARIGLKDIRATSTYEIPDSEQARAIRDCFGLDGNTLKVSLVGPVTIEASGGNIILITGPSGSGKSVLLRAIADDSETKLIHTTYIKTVDKPFVVGWLTEINSDKPIIEYFSGIWGMESSISALNQAGLSEAFVYLRPYKLLSRGQQYRARLAALSLGSANVWLMDEFCADLDPFTARIVSNNLRKHVVRTGRIAIVAAANNAHYIDALMPNRIIYLRHNGRCEVFKYKEYIDEFRINAS